MIPVVAACIRDGDTVFLAKRGSKMTVPGIYEFPGGKVEPGETPKQALEREFKEELGVAIEAGEAIDFFTIESQGKHYEVTVHYAKLLEPKENMRLMQHEDMRWVTSNEALTLPMYEPERRILFEKIFTPTKISTSAFITHKNAVLLVRRKSGSGALAGYWELPGGKVEKDESPTEGMAREVREEIGVDCMVGDLFISLPFVTSKGVYMTKQGFFVTVSSHDFVLSEHDQYVWSGEKELDSFLIAAKMRECIQKGFDLVKNN